MGVDELNLAEFPLSLLSDRARRGQKTLVFEDEIRDRGRKQRVTRRLTITGSDEFGLPTAVDDEVVLGLAQVMNSNGCVKRKVCFSRYELIRILGWRHEGKSYRRLETSLYRWLGVTLHYANAWWDRSTKCWVSENFHILDNVRLIHGVAKRPRQNPGGDEAEPAGSFIVWNDVIFRSLQNGHIKKLDMDLYRSLGSAVAKRMFRFLDKRFYQSPQWDFELKRFACEHVGLSRCYGCAELKRLLTPAILELEQSGFLVPKGKAERFRQLRRGHWEVHFQRSGKRRRDTADSACPIETELVARGVNAHVAHRLAGEYPDDRIRASIAQFDCIMKQKSRESLKNPPGLLVQTIRSGTSSAQSRDPNGSPRRIRDSSTRKGRIQVPKPRFARPAQPATQDKDSTAVREYLSSLSADQKRQLEEEAHRGAPAICRDGVARAKQQNNAELVSVYHDAIVLNHVRRLLKTDDK